MSNSSSIRSSGIRSCGIRWVLLASALLCAAPLQAQKANPPKSDKKSDKKAKSDSAKDPGKPSKPKVSKLFKSEAPIAITFTGNFKALKKDKGTTPPWRAVSIGYTDSAGKAVSIPLRARTRGIWRLANCDFPPLRLNFANKTSKATIFDDLDEPKMVSYCKSGGTSDQYVLQELQLYRIYALLTDMSHHTRLLRVSYVDSASGKTELTRYAFLIEDPQRMAERLGGHMLERKGAGFGDVDPLHSARMFLFQYFIGNTDFSFATLHNGELLVRNDGNVVPVAYDFDFAGAINPPYAMPAPGLRIKTVRERQFRGFCGIRAEYAKVLPEFEAKKNAIYALYADTVGMLIDRRTVKETLEYYDAFYREVKTPKDFDKNVMSDCSDQR